MRVYLLKKVLAPTASAFGSGLKVFSALRHVIEGLQATESWHPCDWGKGSPARVAVCMTNSFHIY